MKYHSVFFVVPLFLFSASAMSAVAPKITKISVTPTSAPAGTMFKFTAELNAPLPTGYKLKIAPVGLTGFTSMMGSDNSYSLSRAIYKAGKQTYKVVIVNAKNVTQGSAKTGSYTVTSAAPINHAPTLALIKAETSAITNTAYTVTLNAKDVDANLNSITMNWGDSTAPETVTATDSKDLVFSHTYATASSFGWNAFATDKGSPALTSKLASKIVTVSKPVEVVVKPVVLPKTISYSKIANDGSLLPNDAKLGTNPTDWACTKDNQTGLIWEVKTTDGGLRDSAKTYTWDNSFNFAANVNAQGLCGAKDWRLPTIQELGGLLVCSDGKYTTNGNEYDNANGAIDCTNILTISRPTINTTYFPDIKDNYWFWSSSPASGSDSYAWGIAAYYGNSGNDVKSYGNNVRLVR